MTSAEKEREAIVTFLDQYTGKFGSWRGRFGLAWRALRYGEGQIEACGYSFARRIERGDHLENNHG